MWIRVILLTALQSKRWNLQATQTPSQRSQRAQPRDPLVPKALLSQRRACGRGGQPWPAKNLLFQVHPLLHLFLWRFPWNLPAVGTKQILPGPVEGIHPLPLPNPKKNRPPGPRNPCHLLHHRNKSLLLPSLTLLPPYLPKKPQALPRGAPYLLGRAGLLTGAWVEKVPDKA